MSTAGMVRVRVRGTPAWFPGAQTQVPGLWVASTTWGYPVVMLRTGLVIGSYPDPEAALAAAAGFGRLGIDFTAPGEEVRRALKRNQPAVMTVVRRWHGRTGLPVAPGHYQDLP